MWLNHKFSRTFSILILGIAVCVFLLPNIISMFEAKRLKTAHDKFYAQEEKAIDDRIKSVDLSIKALGLPDKNLEKCIYGNAIEYSHIHPMNLGGIDSIQQLKGLICQRMQIEDISGIEKMTGLQYLTLNNNKISRIDSLALKKNLIELNLDKNSITDFSPLAGMAELKTLLLEGNRSTDIKFLSAMPNLKTVSLPTILSIYCSDLENLMFGSCIKVRNFNDFSKCKGQYSSTYAQFMSKKIAGMALTVEEEIVITEYELNQMKKLPAKKCSSWN